MISLQTGQFIAALFSLTVATSAQGQSEESAFRPWAYTSDSGSWLIIPDRWLADADSVAITLLAGQQVLLDPGTEDGCQLLPRAGSVQAPRPGVGDWLYRICGLPKRQSTLLLRTTRFFGDSVKNEVSDVRVSRATAPSNLIEAILPFGNIIIPLLTAGLGAFVTYRITEGQRGWEAKKRETELAQEVFNTVDKDLTVMIARLRHFLARPDHYPSPLPESPSYVLRSRADLRGYLALARSEEYVSSLQEVFSTLVAEYQDLARAFRNTDDPAVRASLGKELKPVAGNLIGRLCTLTATEAV